MSNELKEVMKRGRDFIAANLSECCREELEWQNTALLCDGKLREAAAIYKEVDKVHAIPIAQAEISRQAMKALTTPSPIASPSGELPPLPEPVGMFSPAGPDRDKYPVWSLAQVIDYALAAIAHQPPKAALTDEQIDAISDTAVADEMARIGRIFLTKAEERRAFARAIESATAPNAQLVAAIKEMRRAMAYGRGFETQQEFWGAVKAVDAALAAAGVKS